MRFSFICQSLGETSEQAKAEDPAIGVALADAVMQEAIQGKDVRCIEVFQQIDLEGYACSGTTVAIALVNAGSETAIYACVDSTSATVTHMVFLP